MRFRDLSVGTCFDWIDDVNPSHNSFFDQCIKTGPRSYRSHTGLAYRVGSINARVYHVDVDGRLKAGGE